MNTEPIRKRLRDRGPHVLRTPDGQEFAIPLPEFGLMGRHNVVIEDEQGLLEVIDPLHVISIRSTTPRKGRNGGRVK